MCCIIRGWFSALLHSNVSLQSLHTLFSFTPLLLHTPSVLPSLSLHCFSHLLRLLWPFRLSFPFPYFKLLWTKYVTNTWNFFATDKENYVSQKLSINLEALAWSARLLNTHCQAWTLTCRAVACYNMLQCDAKKQMVKMNCISPLIVDSNMVVL